MNQALEVLSRPLLVEPNSLQLMIAPILSNIQKGVFLFDPEEQRKKMVKNEALKLKQRIQSQFQHHPMADGDISICDDPWMLDSSELAENTIAIIPVVGGIWPWISQEIEEMVSMAMGNPKVGSLLFLMNTPGGSVFYLDIVSSLIQSCTKPKATLVYGMCCSAGMWLASNTGRIYCTSPMDLVGSIGTKCTIIDPSKYYDELGFKVDTIYATESTEKDNQYRKWQTGDNSAIISDLDYINQIFKQTVIQGLKIKSDSEVFKANTFYPSEAEKYGLITGIATPYQVALTLTTQSKF